jgi:hypothetical protein
MSETETAAPDPNALTTHESSDGRTLSGMGVTPEALADVMERHEPESVAPTETPAAPAEPAKQSRGQARFAELTKARKEAEAQAATYQRELAELRAQVQPPTASTPPAPAPGAAAAPAPPSPSGPERGDSGHPSGLRSKPTEDEIGTKYKSYADFSEDLTDWKLEQRQTVLQSAIDAQIRQGIEADRASRDFLSHAESTWAKGRKVYADFDAMRTTGPGSQVPMSHLKIQKILQHPQSEHVQYAIVKDGALATRLAQADDMDFGLLLATVAPTNGAVPLASTPSAGTITPPAPIQPVGSGSPTTPTPSADAARKGDYAAYKARREAERSGRR